MKIARIEASARRVALTRPYAIAGKATDAVDLVVVRMVADDGTFGLGSATPEPTITGETLAACTAALAPAAVRWLVGRDVDVDDFWREARRRAPAAPGACAALDMALHDLRARRAGRPLADLLGRVHAALPTSITIGIKPLAETLVEADEYLARGFRCLKVKIGRSIDDDVARLVRLRERVGSGVAIRVDANQGYDLRALQRLLAVAADLDLELIEQPLPAGREAELRALPPAARRLLAADESAMDERDAAELTAAPPPFGAFVVKLMKCGGIGPALAIAKTAAAHRVDLMWGCMDESTIGISAALHTAFACRATRWLDLDGSFDLAEDVAVGGFVLANGVLRTLDRPGLGVDLRSDLEDLP